MDGGIGDHIEELSRIIPWMEENKQNLELSSSRARIAQLHTVTEGYKWNAQNNDYVSSKCFLAALGDKIPGPKSFIKLKNRNYKRSGGILFCLTAVGSGDNLSKWARSLDFRDGLRLIKSTVLGIRNSTDISDWKDWEVKTLNSMGLQRYDPKQGDIKDLTELVFQHDYVITIDTALAHLCAAIGKKCVVMLPKYHDERWHDLMEGDTSYSRIAN